MKSSNLPQASHVIRTDAGRKAGGAALCKPRNPLVAAALLRTAGRHGPSNGARRRGQAQALQRELTTLHAVRWSSGDT